MWEAWSDEERELTHGGPCGGARQEGGNCSGSGTLKKTASTAAISTAKASSRTTFLETRRNRMLAKFGNRFPALSKERAAQLSWDALSLDQQRVVSGTWVLMEHGKKKSRCILRCRFCDRAVAVWDAKSRKRKLCGQLLKQHGRSKRHNQHVSRAIAGQTDCIGRPIVDESPTVDEFQKLWCSFSDGKLARRDMDAKASDMANCLNEAIRETALQALLSAESIALMRDERRQRLMLRFACCGKDLAMKSGLVGVARNFGTGHVAISRATVDLVQRICNGDRAMAAAILNKVELFCVDAANDEVLSCERMRGRSGEDADDVPAVTPNLKVIFRDGAHASRRFLSRLWKADETINEVISGVVRNKHSITMRIHNSVLFTNWFHQEVRRDGGRIQNLRAAKHRFESFATPLSRLVLHFPALLRTSERIARERHGLAEGNDAVTFLKWVSPKSVILLAMCADAAVEVLTFTRQCDREDVDSAEIPGYLSDLLGRIEQLFVQGECMRVAACFSARMQATIAANRITYVVDGGLRSLDEPSSADIHFCLGIMARWVSMVRITAAAEFPDFTVLTAFRIFSLASTASSSHMRIQENTGSIERLAHAFGVCPVELHQDMVRWRPVAEQVRKNTRCGNKEAWAQALKPLLRDRKHRRFNANALLTVIPRYIAWCVATSGIESVFSASERVMQSRGSSSELFEENMLRLVAARTKDSTDTTDVLDRARAIWSTRFGRRTMVGHRVDKGIKRKRMAMSEATVLAQRTEAVAAKVSAGAVAELVDEDPDQLPPGIQQEIKFQKDKLQQRKVEALRDGVLLPSEVDDALQEALAVELDRVQERAKTRAAAARRIARHCAEASCNWGALSGLAAWVEDDANSAACASGIQLRGLRVVLDPFDGDVLVVKDVSSLTDLVRLLAGCKGLHVLAADTVVAGDSGAFLVLNRALRLRRFIWATASFQTEHASLWDHTVKLAASRGSKWKVLATSDDFANRVQKEKSKVACVTLATNGDQHSLLLGTVLTKGEFLEWLFVVDFGVSNLGR